MVPPLGSLCDRIQLRRRDASIEPEGGQFVVFTPLGHTWSRVRHLSARSGETADGRSVGLSHAVVMRFRSDIGPGDRVIYRGRSLEIVSAEDLNGRRAYLSCLCAETAVTG